MKAMAKDRVTSFINPWTSQKNRVAPSEQSTTKINQLVPVSPSAEELKRESKRVLGRQQNHSLSFGQAFGVLGFPMLCILLVCIAWTSWLIFLALAPTMAANMLMDTSSYDNGRFWLFNDANPQMVFAGAVGLVIVDICYVLVTLRMLLWRDKLFGSAYHTSYPTTCAAGSYSWMVIRRPTFKRFQLVWGELTAFGGRNRKKWNVFLKLIDIAMESALLRQLLQNGSPVSLTYGFASFLALNALSCVVNVLTDRFSALTEVFIDSVFDLSAAVLFPITTLVYCYYNFDFDREVFLTYLEKLPPGSFEHLARSFADQSELALFRVNFDSLRIDSLLDFGLRISMNLTFCYRFERVLQSLVWTRHRALIVQRLQPANDPQVPQNSVPKGVSAVFLAVSLGVLLSTHKAIADSTALCSPHPECVVYAHRWGASNAYCPCLIFIDVNLAPKTYNEWIHPIDAYEKVKTLAGAGMLTSLQVVNRQLLKWPEELRKCRDLRAVYVYPVPSVLFFSDSVFVMCLLTTSQVMYTNTQHLPSWTNELQNLETIQIEGKYNYPNLLDLPENLFSSLPRLSMVHFGLHENIDHIPSLTGVPNLQSLSLAWLPRLRTLPSLDYLPNLSRLILSLLPNMEQLPDITHLPGLVDFVVLRPNHICCNGFLGACNLSHISCSGYPSAGIPAATCLTDGGFPAKPFLGNAEMKHVLEKFGPTICQPSSFDTPDYLSFPTKLTVEMCEGKPYRQCFLPGNRTGLCYNTRFQVLSCLSDDNYINLRRLQIERGVGPACDPEEEKWLGCTG